MKKTVKKYFVPHEKNEYKPYFFRGRSVLCLGSAILLLFGLSFFQTLLIKNSQFSAIISTVIVDLTNEDRIENDLTPLAMNPVLKEAAQRKANDMAAKGYFSHNSPDGITPWHWFREAGYKYAFAGENLAVNFSDSEEVAKAWMLSPSHKDNILNSKFTEIGVATAKGIYNGRETVFVVQLFGRPAPDASLSAAPVPLVGTREVEPAAGIPEPEPEEEKIQAEQKVIASEDMFIAVENTRLIPEIQETVSSPVNYSSSAEKLMASPNNLLLLIYSLIAVIIFLALLIFIIVEIRRQHLLYVAYGFSLLVLMLLLLYADNYIVPEVLVK